jgi:hypothetical protein
VNIAFPPVLFSLLSQKKEGYARKIRKKKAIPEMFLRKDML